MAIIPTVLATTNNTTVKTALQSNSIISKIPIGSTPTAAGATVTVAEYSTGRDITTVLTLNSFVVGAIPAAAAALGVGAIVYSFPASPSQHFELVYGFSSLVATLPGTAVNLDLGLGSVVASGAVSVLSGTGTFEDRLTGQTVATAAAGGAAASALLAATAGIGTGISLNVAASVKNVFLNASSTFNVNNLGNLSVSGQIILKWTLMGGSNF